MSNLKFGLRVPAFSLDGSLGNQFRDEILAYCAAFENSYDSLWVADHFVPWYTPTDEMTDTLECWTALAYLAGKFEQYDLGTIVMAQSYRQPALLAKMGATLQFLSGGRFILGIGAGWKKDEYLSYGYDFPSTATRIHQMGEAVQIIKRMWTEPKASFQGKYYQIEEAICSPKPEPLPPIMIGGGGKKITLRYVAQHADWWNFPGGTPDNYAALLDVLRQHCEAVGRDFGGIVKTWAIDCVAVADTHETALALARKSPLYDAETAVVGTPDEVAAYLRRFTRLGVQQFMFRFADFPQTDAAALFAREVIPQLTG